MLRRDLHVLSARLATHPFWRSAAGRSPAARVDLRRHVWALEEAMDNLTDQQERIVECIRGHEGTPSMREIGESVGLASTASVAYQLERLAELGVIKRGPEERDGRIRRRPITLCW
ncbi:MarR family transcriptional regulator [Streptomyces sp. NPDC008092]|uniref:LexA family protein n=1 Tax=Streptomyces sp. NPDC008092 TaxID=3364808 RepID=UPI0036E8203B